MTDSRKNGGALGWLLALVFLGAPLLYWQRLANPYDLPKGAVLEGLGVALAALLFLVAGFRRQDWSWPREVFCLLFFLAWALFSWFLAPLRGEGVSVLLWFGGLCCWWVVGQRVLGQEAARRRLLGGLAVSSALVAALGLLQWLGWDHWGAAGDPFWKRLFANLPQTDHPGSVFGHVNVAAEFVLAGWLASLGLWLKPPEKPSPSSLPGRLLLLGGLGLDGTFLLVSGTRAAWLGALGGALGLLCCLLRARWRHPQGESIRLRGLLLGLLAVGTLLGVLDVLVTVPGRGGGPPEAPHERLGALLQTRQGTVHERLVLWSNTLAMVADHPWAGVGPGNWKIFYPAYGRARAVHPASRFGLRRQPRRAHNDPLQLLAETGLVGFLALAWFLLMGLWRSWRRATRGGAASSSPERATFAILLGLGLVSLAAFPFQDALPGPLLFLLLGSVAGRSKSARGTSWRLGLSSTRLQGVGIALLIFLGLVLLHLHTRLVGSGLVSRSELLRASAHQLSRSGTAPAERVRGLLLEALDAMDRAALRVPASFRYQQRRAAILQELGLGDRAQEAESRALRLDPYLGGALLSLAGGYRLLGEWPRARRLLARALALYPDSPEVNLGYGLFLQARARTLDLHTRAGRTRYREDQNNARHFYQRSLRRGGYHPDARLALAALELDEGLPPAQVLPLLQEARTELWGEGASGRGGDAERLARCARLFADPRLQSLGGLFGPVGKEPERIWKRVLFLSHGTRSDARLEVVMQPFKLALQGAPLPPRKTLRSLDALVGEILGREPRNLAGLYYGACLKEKLGRPRAALLLWGRLLRAVAPGQQARPEVAWLLGEALAARKRLRKKVERKDKAPPP